MTDTALVKVELEFCCGVRFDIETVLVPFLS